jgi:[citrate (pro-3S)-lyase] ligase
MAELLPIYGIEVDIIPRISLGQAIISASVVRKYLECRDFFSIEKIVPECTYNYLRNEFSN